MTSDLDLLTAWRAGDVDAGGVLFERHFPPVYGFFRNKTSGAVDDLVQKTFMACVEGRDRVSASSFRAYLFGVARNVLYGEFRNRRKQEAVDFGVSSVHDLDPGPSTAVGKKEEHRLLLRALRRIPLNYQVALELYYIEGLRGPELAEILDVPLPTVRSRIRRGLEQVKKEIERLASSPSLAESTAGGLESWAAELGTHLAPPAS
jgi:RNA polymerase sigma-70 factor (ECF subfamily)